MISSFKKNKLFLVLLMMSVFVIAISIFLTAFFDKKINEEITNNIILLINQIKKGTYISILQNEIKNSAIYIFFLWIIGISIIGIPILLFFYFVKLITISFEFVFLLKNIKITGIFFPILYIIPKFINIILYFFLLNHAIKFSIILIKMIFFKKNYNIQILSKRYIFVLLITELGSVFITILDNFLVPKVFPLLVS